MTSKEKLGAFVFAWLLGIPVSMWYNHIILGYPFPLSAYLLLSFPIVLLGYTLNKIMGAVFCIIFLIQCLAWLSVIKLPIIKL